MFLSAHIRMIKRQKDIMKNLKKCILTPIMCLMSNTVLIIKVGCMFQKRTRIGL